MGSVARGDARAILVVVLGALLVSLAFFAFPFLPFQDLPAHAGLIALRQRLAEGGPETAYYVLDEQLNPYFAFRFTGGLLARVVGPVMAVRILGFIPVVALPAALATADRRFTGKIRPEVLAIGLLVASGFMTLLGFASFLLGLALYAYLAGAWLEAIERAGAGEELVLGRHVRLTLLTSTMVLVHGHAFLLLLATCAAFVAAGPTTRVVQRTLFGFAPALVLSGVLFVRQNGAVAPPLAAKVPYAPLSVHFQGPLDKASLLATPTLFSKYGVDALLGVLLMAYAVQSLVPSLTDLRAASSRERRLVAAAALLILGFLVLPHSVGWFGFVDGRLLAPFILLAALARRVDAPHRALAPFAALLQGVVVLVATLRFQTEASSFAPVASHVPPLARLLYLPLKDESTNVTGHPFLHYDKLLLAEKPLVVSQFWWHQGTGVYPRPGHPALETSLARDYVAKGEGTLRWSDVPLERYSHVLVRGRIDVPPGFRIEAENGLFRLYSRVASTTE